ncbi:hypothetical protein UCD39_00660 [Nitrospirillum sp. BR 11752]|nr:hypothetical protein [Nitrospirillum sp. BR 11752]
MSDMHDRHGDPDYDYDPGYDWQGRRQPPPGGVGFSAWPSSWWPSAASAG